MSPPWWQGDKRWGGLLLGTGPSHCDVAGCVACALAAAAARIAGRDVNPGSAILHLRETPGAFVGDELVIPVAAPALGLDAGPLIVGDDAMRAMLKNALARPDACALLRLEVDGPGLAKPEGHTVLAVTDADTVIECLDSACPSQEGVQEGFCVIRWVDLKNASPLLWNREARTYRVKAARELRKAQEH